jgi:hypothetical protein
MTMIQMLLSRAKSDNKARREATVSRERELADLGRFKVSQAVEPRRSNKTGVSSDILEL